MSHSYKEIQNTRLLGCSAAWGCHEAALRHCGGPSILSTRAQGAGLSQTVGDAQALATSPSLPSHVPICLCPTAGCWQGARSVPLLQTGQSPGGRRKPQEGAAFLRDPTALRAILPLRGPLPSVTSLPPSAHGIMSLLWA